MPPVVAILFASKPVKPDKFAIVPLKVKVPVVKVRVFNPLRIPLSVIPFGIVGFDPKGKVQSLPIVFTPVCPVKLTMLNNLLPQAIATVPPSKIIVPLLWLNVLVDPKVKVLAKVALTVGAVNVVPLFIVNAPLISTVVYDPKFK